MQVAPREYLKWIVAKNLHSTQLTEVRNYMVILQFELKLSNIVWTVKITLFDKFHGAGY